MANTDVITYYGVPDKVYDPKDITDNGKLTAAQVDNNFNVLEGRIIKNVEMSNDGTKIIITLFNGTKFVTEIGEDLATKEFVIQNIENSYVFSDGSLNGNGTIKDPLKLAPSSKTGVYKPITKIVQQLPANPKVGDRFVIDDTIDKNGALYNYKGVLNIIENLEKEFENKENPWKVASKHDWDSMLNALEPEKQDKTHCSPKEAEYLGEFAGAYIQKDEYGFNMSLCGYASLTAKDTRSMSFIGEKEGWWTDSNDKGKRAFIKRIDKYTEEDNGGVYQDVESGDHFYSVRLVRDMNPNEDGAQETIMGERYPVVQMPSEDRGLRLWTSVNFKSNLIGEDSVKTTDLNNECRYVPTEWEPSTIYNVCEWNGDNWIKTTINTYDCFFLIEDKAFYYLDEDGTLKPVQVVSDAFVKKSDLASEVSNILTDMTKQQWIDLFKAKLDKDDWTEITTNEIN